MSSESRYREPLALTLLRAFCAGKTVEELVAETGIPEERLRLRLKAAERYFANY